MISCECNILITQFTVHKMDYHDVFIISTTLYARAPEVSLTSLQTVLADESMPGGVQAQSLSSRGEVGTAIGFAGGVDRI